MPHLAISLLGSFQAELDGVPISGFVSVKAQALLAYLVVEARAHGREELGGLLWPDYPEASARANLRSVLANVRRLIADRQAAPPHLEITRQTIRFNLASDCELDIAHFGGLSNAQGNLDGSAQGATANPAGFAVGSARGATANAAGSSQPVIELLAAAVARVQGPFLAGFSLADSAAFEEWILLRREFFDRQINTALQRLAGHYEQSGEYEQALAYAWRWLASDAWQEEAHQQVMKLLAYSGRRNEALLQYERCRQTLVDGLGVEPSDQTTLLYQQIRSGALSSRTQQQEVNSPSPLPRPLMPLIGRERELAELSVLLANSDLRLITIVGPGGIGKTHLALEVAANQQPLFADGVFVIQLAPLQTMTAVIPTIAQTLRFSFYDHVPQAQQLLDYLRGKQLLLVLDNVEHLPECAGLIVKLLPFAPRLKILATARARLHIRGEQLYPLAGLAYPSQEISGVSPASNRTQPYGAVKLWQENASRLRPDFVLTHTDLPDVVRICRLLNGMPLGILLASTWLDILTPHEIANELERNFAFLQVTGQGLPERHQSLTAVFEHTWSLLTEREQAIMQQCAIFRDGFTPAAVHSVTEALLPDLLALTSKFLLHRTHQGRYEIHELVRQFAASKLSQSPVTKRAIHQRHSAYYVDFLHQREKELKGAHQQAVLAEIRAEDDNIGAAWSWAAEQMEAPLLDRAIACLGYYYEWQARYQEGEAACRIATKQPQLAASATGLGVLVKILLWQARFNRLLGNSEQAGQLTQQSLDLLDSPALAKRDIRAEQAMAALERGQLAASWTEAEHWLQRALNLFRACNDVWGTAQTLHVLAQGIFQQPGASHTYQRLLEESLQLFQSVGDQRSSANVLETIGFFWTLYSRAEEGEKALEQALAIRRQIGTKADLARTLHSLAFGYGVLGKFADEYTVAKEAMKLHQDLGNRPGLAASHRLFAATHLALGHYVPARSHIQAGLELSQADSDLGSKSYLLWLLGDLALVQGAPAEAEVHLQESIAIHRQLGIHGRLNDVFLSLGHAAYMLGRPQQVRECLVQALQGALADRVWFTGYKGVALAALQSLINGQAEQAIERYALASRSNFIANSAWYRDVVGRQMVTVIEKQRPDIVAAAQKRGQAHDLWEAVAELLAGQHSY